LDHPRQVAGPGRAVAFALEQACRRGWIRAAEGEPDRTRTDGEVALQAARVLGLVHDADELDIAVGQHDAVIAGAASLMPAARRHREAEPGPGALCHLEVAHDTCRWSTPWMGPVIRFSGALFNPSARGRRRRRA